MVQGWQGQHPLLAQTNFGQVWRRAEQHDGGDCRDFVRYFSWSSSAILEKSAPLMDQVMSGQLPLDAIAASAPAINAHVRDELNKTLTNPSMNVVFREKIKALLEAYDRDSRSKL